ncbi:hypothetical protein ABCS02_10290 [Microbacterium sp. X-17]|uniref:DUF7144 family membrane protein n=1 Tax=Microbacterium sp. X-17 TaxID=3144404 RepID=UPI0031F55D24
MSDRRPFGVTLVAVIAWITGAIQIVSGIVALFRGDAGVGWIELAVGVITIVVSLGLFSGNRGARIVVTIVFALNVIGSILIIITNPLSFWAALWSGLFPLIGLFLLYSRPANAFFARR